MFNFLKKKKMLAIYDLECAAASYAFIEFFQSALNYKNDKKINEMDIAIISGKKNGFKESQFTREKNFKKDFANLRMSNIVFPLLYGFNNYFSNFIFLKKRNDFYKIKKNYTNFFPPNYQLNIKKKNYNSQIVWSNIEKRESKTQIAKLNENRYLKTLIKRKIKKKFITITLRESNYNKTRNNNLKNWKKLISFIENKKFNIIVLRDMEKIYADNFFKNYELFPEATLDLNFRLNLYSLSKVNLFVSNGPQMLSAINNYKSIAWKHGEDFYPNFNSINGTKIYSTKLSKKVVFLNINDDYFSLKSNLKRYAKI